ncbi:MAG TPA: N-acetyltransferase [Planctomycetota bacterium]|nr:N-acetyltransferase [Planctomycetota bacterium]HRR79100.1 N-acetyltransferase [Planctomycetota bacterium]HRT93167.1 N-acetyltransferase [Planctomycetota bacterium]
MSDAIEVRPVANRRERRAFLRLPWEIYCGDPNWVPPLLSSVDHMLDPRRNPFYEHAESRLYLAWRGGRPVGRIVATVNHLHNERYHDGAGFWGFFEAEEDPAVAQALLDRAAEDLRSRGLASMRGPFNPSINAECGVLIEGFDRPPSLLMPYNPPYYPDVIQRAGHTKHKDLLAYYLDQDMIAPGTEARERMERIEALVRRRNPELTIRTIDMTRFEDEVLALGELFNLARERNWGFVPVTPAEMRAMAREIRPILVPDCVILAEVAGRLAGCTMGLPDIGPLLKKANGRLLPFGWFHLLFGRRRLDSMRIFGAAVHPDFRNLGVIPLLFLQYLRHSKAHGFYWGELSWVAEDNVASMRTLEAAFKPRLYKRYRIYEKAL